VSHRIILNAYYNALLNYNNQFDHSADIFDRINFKQAGKVVMIGYFLSLVQKFEENNIQLSIFDLFDTSEKVTPLEKQKEYISKANTLILTSTSIFNNTFQKLINATPDNCQVFLLGPSTLMHPDMFNYRNINILFGSLFEKENDEVVEIIKKGEGTPSFSKHMTKVFLMK